MEAGKSTVEWELSKENIQPLKQGRQFSKLNNILQPNTEETQKKRETERQAFETELRTYSGSDPLDPWYRYISWIEQSYPKGGKEGNIHVILEKCIQKFKDDKSVHSDSRYLEAWLKYAAISAKPLDIYDFMFKQGICTQQPGLYEAWAWQLESAASYKKAEVVFVKGIGAMTESHAKEGLAARQKQFQARVVRRLKGEEIPAEETEEEQRAALGKLRGHGKHAKVGSIRVGSAKMGGPGVLQVNKQPLKDNNRPGGFAIFQDENAPMAGAAGGGGPASIPSSRDRKENEMSAGRWGKARVGRGNVPLDKITQNNKAAFTVHQDEAIVQPLRTPQKVEKGVSNILSARKVPKDEGIVNCPLALFEPVDPSKRPMYCKDKVYQGATEFSFEELQAARWKTKEAARQEARDIEVRRGELQEMEAKLREQQEQVARQMAEFQKMLAGGAVAQGALAGAVVNHASRSIGDDDSEPTPFTVYSDEGSSAGRSNDSSSIHSLSRKNSAGNSLDDTAALMSANPLGSRSRSFGRSAKTPSPHGNKGPVMSGPSPTVNTKEAMAMMQQLWSKPVGEPSFVIPSELTPTDQQKQHQQQKFEIFSDDRPTPIPIYGDQEPEKPAPFPIFSDQESAPFPIFSDQQAAPFPIFSDQANVENVKAPNKSRKSRAALFNQIDDKENGPLPLPMEENHENIPPPDYNQPPTHLRSKTGILSQAENVAWMPLEEQEKLLDEDERRQEEEFDRAALPTFANPNATMALPNEEAFEKMANMASTPFTGRPFQPDDDENTCAIQLVYRDHHTAPDNDENDDSMMMAPPEPPQSNPNSLSPIVETSREYYKSSSSSSGPSDASMHGVTRGERSHWGNTGSSTHYKTTDQTRTPGQTLGKTTDNTRTPGESLASLARTPGQFMGTSSVSGYMGDKSSMSNCTKSNGKLSESRGITRDFVASPAVNGSDKKPRMAVLESPPRMMDPDLEEDTGMFSDMMAEFRVNMVPVKEVHGRQEEKLERSLQASFVDAGVREEEMMAPGLNMTGAPTLNMTGAPGLNMTTGPLPLPTLNMTGAPGLNMTAGPLPLPTLNMTGAPGLNMTGAQACNMTGTPGLFLRTPGLNMTGAPGLNMTGAPGLNMTGAPGLNMTAAPAPLNMTGAARLDTTGAPTLNMTGAPALNMTGAPALNMTGAPALNMTGAPALNMTGAPALNMTGAPALNMTGAPALNMTGAPALNMTGFLSPINPDLLVEETANMSLEDDFDPFNPAVHQRLLTQVSIPPSQRHGYQRISGKLPQIRARSVQKLGDDTFYVSECKGEGGFAKVWAATRQDTDHDSTIAGIDAVLKVQKPANEWEWYICTEVQERLQQGPDARLENGFMSIPRCYSFDDGGIFVSYHQKLGTLLDITNLTKKCGVQKSCIEPMAMYFTIEMLGLVEALHKINIIHADVKADNFLLQAIPSINKNATSAQQMFSSLQPALQLIDFGKAIDLSILPNNTIFSSLVKTDGLKCVEMREGKPWKHHIDYFGLAATTYCLLFGNYMEIVQVGGVWEVKGSYKRWWQVPLWKEFFAEFLNLGGLEKENLPKLLEWKEKFSQVFFEKNMGNHLDTLRSDVTKFLAGY